MCCSMQSVSFFSMSGHTVIAHFIDTIHHDEAYVVIPVQVRNLKITQNTP